MMFKCGNADVMDLSTGEIFNRSLLPIGNWGKEELSTFLDTRGTGLPHEGIKGTETLSLSDSYWVSEDESLKFQDISPYFKRGAELEKACELIHVRGASRSRWGAIGDKTYLIKMLENVDAKRGVRASKLASVIGLADGSEIICNQRFSESQVFYENITSTEVMLLDLEIVFGRRCLYNPKAPVIYTLERLYEKVGMPYMMDYILNVMLFDCLVGNKDRKNNAANWGFLKDTVNGLTDFCPVYDFDSIWLEGDGGADFLYIKREVTRAGQEESAGAILSLWEEEVRHFCNENNMDYWYSRLKTMQEIFE